MECPAGGKIVYLDPKRFGELWTAWLAIINQTRVHFLSLGIGLQFRRDNRAIRRERRSVLSGAEMTTLWGKVYQM